LRCLNKDVAFVPGSGAAGGLGAALLALVEAELQPGISIVRSATRLKERIATADLVLTGEGQIDFQTAHGKTACGVAEVARGLGVPVIAIGGSIDPSASALDGAMFTAMFSICSRPMDLRSAMEEAEYLLTTATANVILGLLAGVSLERRCSGD